MSKLARLPATGRSSDDEAAARRMPRLRTRYYAFLSYSHQDKELADWLHRELERFRVPHSLAGKLTANGIVPRRLTPVFRDQQDLSAGGELADEIKAALAASQFLVVLCSPTAAKSRWTNAEIESFKRTRPEGCVLAAVAGGEPFASDIPDREDEECFPPALRYKYDRRGHRTAKRAEPLAADFREAGEGRRLALLKLVAGMLGVGLDELVQRETTRRHRQLAWLAAGSLAGMAVTSTLAISAIQARNEAREQRREAEGLVAFMLGDLKDKLEPIGRLDALDGVGTRVLAYYKKQDTSQLSDAALLQRSRALTLSAEVASLRGNSDTALRLYQEALAGTAEAMRRDPSDPARLFDHAQNVFYLANAAMDRGDLREGERGMRQYKDLALKMVALDPDNMKWRMEEQYAEADLGTVLFNQRRFPEAASQFAQALHTIEALTTADPGNGDYQKSLVEAVAWLADANAAQGNYAGAMAQRERHVALLNRLLAGSHGDVVYRQKLVPAERALANLYAASGRADLADQHFLASIDHAERLTSVEPGNTRWLEYGYRSRVDYARHLIATNRVPEATLQSNMACATVDQLRRKDSTNPQWQGGQRDCWMLRAELALATHADDDAQAAAGKALNLARAIKSSDPVSDAYSVGNAYRLVGDVLRARGDQQGARAAWSAGLGALPSGAAERPSEMKLHAELLDRLGRDSRALAQRLTAMGYKGSLT